MMICVLVVLYNRGLQSSETLSGILRSDTILKGMNAFVNVWDNSPEPILNKGDIQLLEQKFNFEYEHCQNNKPLSDVYNSLIEKATKTEKYKYVVVLDHDSKITSSYFSELKSIIEASLEADFVLPVVKNKGIIVSPAKLFLVKGNYFTSINKGIYKGKLLAINSGMAISVSFIKRYKFRYSRGLKNYGTDNYIMNFANSVRASFYIMDSSFDHSLSFYDETDIREKAAVFSQIKKANKIVFSLNRKQKTAIHIYNILASLKNTIKYRSIRFLS
jgi:hypothetical protein